ncbi:MAG: hypothetical protein R3F39_21140, partial [Myxococcota bacterium]
GGVEPPPKPAVTVAAQTADPANQVVVAEVISSGPGFIVIHEDDGAGSFGAVLGHTAVVDGKNTAVKVTLSRDAVDGETLYAMLHTDAGVVGTYEFPGPDGPVLGDAGAPISPSFVVSVAAVVTNDLAVADQGLEPVDAVVVASVVADVAGWVVIHEDDGAGAPGDAIGNAAVPAGSSSDVVVGLGRQAVEGETLYAMLHIDAGVADVYEFPGPDAPAKDAAGAVVVEPFTVTLLQRLEVSTNSFFLPTDPINVATVDHVVMKAQGFVVIHEDDGAGSFGAVIGYAQVPSGSTTAVKVTLDRDLVAAEVLWPMLHVDLGAPGVYEFPGADVPATDETGAVLVKSFDVEFVTP